MNLTLLIVWILGITCFTVLGSWYARRTGRPDLLIALYVTFVLVAQVLAAKIAAFDLGFQTFYGPSGVLVFAVTFLLTDIVNERFGRMETHRMIGIAFLSQVAMVLFFWLGVRLTPAPFWGLQDAWSQIFNAVPRITLASWAAFLISENFDAVVFAWFKRKTGGRHLWARNAFSSLPALALDSLIFIPLAFAGSAPLGPLIMGQIAVKWLVGLVDIPFMYLSRWIMSGGQSSVPAAKTV
ncbi:MAG: queuosine precursor transporter [Patescibacteria group bacterium]|jgi:hypothetical protein